MTRVALAGLLGRKLRTALTAIAIVLGVAMVSGTFVLTDSINKAFNSIFTDVRKGSDIVVTGKAATSTNNGSTAPTIPESVLGKVRALSSVEVAEGGVDGEAHLIGSDGKAIVFGGAPNLGFSIANGASRFNPLTLVDGAWPKGNEVVIDKSTAGKKHFKVGDEIGVQSQGPVEKLRISGLVKFGTVSTIGGATLAGFDIPTAQKLFDKPGQLDEIAIATKPGVSSKEALGQIRSVLPPNAQARTGEQQAEKDAKDTNAFITFLRGFLLAFGGVALFVGSFVIANSLSITIAQRTRELATLRTLGASRRQVLRSIIIESLVVGTLASIVGLFLGLLLAKGLFKLFDAVGFTLPNSGLVFAWRTVIVALLVGILVTLVASLRPAFRATRVQPIAAVREGATLPESRFARFRTLGSLIITILGFAAMIYGLFGKGLGTAGVLIWMGLGALLIFIGVSMLSMRIVGPAAETLAPPIRWLLTAAWILFLITPIGWIYIGYYRIRYGVLPTFVDRSASSELARDNARRNPQRTASTAAALMIGLALVTFVAVLASGITSSFRGAVNKIWHNAGYAITAQNNFNPIPIAAADAVQTVPGVEAVGNVRTGDAKAFGHSFFATAVNPPGASMFRLDWKVGSTATIAALGDNGAFVDTGYAKKHHLVGGSPVVMTFSNGAKKTFLIRGIFKPPPGGSPFGSVTISQTTWDKFNENPENIYSFVRMSGGDTDANLKALQDRLKSFPNAKAQTRQQFIDNQISDLNSILNILYVLLALSVIVSLFGIVNTLVLTVFERTREIGMLRAIGMTRRQVRRMIRHESVITALMGGVLGIVLGVVLGGLLVYRVDFIQFSLPIASLIIFAVAAIVVGILAAIFPARRAARLNVLEALQYE
ncbi:MAG TPA: FtsX-like permease family protein [Gaiellaceae bacterium]|nr:FtsX-like permease family protein [Gaiellaceae bacterium]